jgi:pimeloyl-ACP methyl ester carboxylesterase
MRVGRLAGQRQWREAYATMFSPMLPRSSVMNALVGPIIRLAIGILGVPKDPSDLVVTIEAEDKFNFKDRLAEIKAPTLVAAGDKDPFYTETLFRETAEGIPNARLILYKGQSHPAGGEQFRRDMLAFLREGAAQNA